MQKLFLCLPVVFLVACRGSEMNRNEEEAIRGGTAESTMRSVEARCIDCENDLLGKFAAGDTAGWSACMAEGLVEHATLPAIISSVGLRGLKEKVMMDHMAFPDLAFNILSRSVEGDMSFLHYNLKGTNTGPLGPVPPTGRTIDINGVMVMRWQNGKAVEHWDYPDIALLMRQLSPATDLSRGKQ